jgi:hypothetical protein
MPEHILRGMTLSLSLLLTSLNPIILLWRDVCLCDTQQGRFELLQLTAGYTHQCRIKAYEADINTDAEDWRNNLQDTKIMECYKWSRLYYTNLYLMYKASYVKIRLISRKLK